MLLVKKASTTGAIANVFKSAAVCLVVVAICGRDRGQLSPPSATTVEDMDLPKSADSMGMEFKLIPRRYGTKPTYRDSSQGFRVGLSPSGK